MFAGRPSTLGEAGHADIPPMFEALRSKVLSTSANYSVDFGHSLILGTDASDYAIGARLFQHIDGTHYNIGFLVSSVVPLQFRNKLCLCISVNALVHSTAFIDHVCMHFLPRLNWRCVRTISR